MSKMTVIQLLNKIANGEEIPQLIKWNGYIYDKLGCEYYMLNDRDITLFGDILDTNGKYLNDEVEIIEEDKKIEKLENEKQFYSYRKYADFKIDIDKILYILKGLNLTEEKIDNLNNKINEIIDKLNEMEKE